MTQHELEAKLYAILDDMQRDAAHRHRLQPQYHAILQQMEDEGVPVPQRLQELDMRLIDEAVEAQFDNMPV